MSARDIVRMLPLISVANGVGTDGVRQRTQGENNKRTERYQLRVRGQVDITVAGAGLRNRGSILAALTDLGFTDGGQDIVALDARLARFIAEAMAPSVLPATRLAGVGVQAATQLEEIVPIFLSAYRTSNPVETKYVEPNKQLAQEVFVTPQKVISRLSGGAPTGTITNLSASVEQVFDDFNPADPNAAPFLNTYVRQIVQDVPAANPALKIDLRGNRYIRGIAIQQDSDAGEVDDIINALVLRGDKRSVIGDRAVTFADLRLAQAYEQGGDIPPGYLWWDFCRYGRLSTMWNPFEDTNLRLEVDTNVSASPGGRIRVAMVEYQRTPATTAALPFNL